MNEDGCGRKQVAILEKICRDSTGETEENTRISNMLADPFEISTRDLWNANRKCYPK
jgi:hypothetical protein